MYEENGATREECTQLLYEENALWITTVWWTTPCAVETEAKSIHVLSCIIMYRILIVMQTQGDCL